MSHPHIDIFCYGKGMIIRMMYALIEETTATAIIFSFKLFSNDILQTILLPYFRNGWIFFCIGFKDDNTPVILVRRPYSAHD